MAQPELTALGTARVRFFASLPKRAEELAELMAELQDNPEEGAVKQRLHTQLQALSASATLFEEVELSHQVERAIEGLAAMDDRGVPARAFDNLAHTVAQLAAFATSHGSSYPPRGAVAAATAAQPEAKASAAADRPVEVSQTVSGLVPAPAPTAIVVIDDEEVLRSVRDALPDARFEVSGTEIPEQALRLMHATSPQVVLVSVDLARDAGLDLVRRIRRDPVTDVRHVLLLGRRVSAEEASQLGCDGSVRRPIDKRALLSMLDGLLGIDETSDNSLRFLTEGTVDDIADRVAEEIRRGLAESLQAGRDERIVLEDTSELMAAAWSAIGRIRTHLGQRSEGRLRFRERGLPGAAGSRALASDRPVDPADDAVARALSGRRILVADDDPAVLWFFAGLLREAGATVWEAKNGKEALQVARSQRPHAILSDILMPKLDGFALCRELQRDVILADAPVILLSWKEDYLHRMRELRAGAAGYLRKEAGSRQILATVADVLRPRARLEAQLEAGREVRGRVERIGMVPLIETVAVRRPNARITVEDAWNMFEVNLREGQRIGVTRTAADGSFARGDKLLQQLLGVRAARYTIETVTSDNRAGLSGPIDRILQEAARGLGSLLDAVSDRHLMRIGHIELDEAQVPAFLSATPAPLGEIIARLRRPTGSVRDWLLSGEIGPQALEGHLTELARRGLIASVQDVDGHDLVAAVRDQRAIEPAAVVRLSIAPPPPPASASLPPWYASHHEGGSPSEESSADGAARDGVAVPAPTGVIAEVVPTAQTQPPISLSDVPGDDRGRSQAAGAGRLAEADSDRDVVGAAQDDAASVADRGVDGPDATAEDAAEVADDASHEGAEVDQDVEGEMGDRARRPGGERRADLAAVSDEPAGVWSEEGPGSRLLVLLTLLVLGAVGYFGFRAIVGTRPTVMDGPSGAAPVGETDRRAARDGTPKMPAPTPAPGPIAPEPAAQGFGRLLPFIDRSRGVEVAPDQGLLVVQASGEGAPARVRVGDRQLGSAPVAVALPEGRHEVVFRTGDQSRFRYLVIRRGETRIVDAP